MNINIVLSVILMAVGILAMIGSFIVGDLVGGIFLDDLGKWGYWIAAVISWLIVFKIGAVLFVACFMLFASETNLFHRKRFKR